MIKNKVEKNLFIGIDLGGPIKRTTGLCILEEKEKEFLPLQNQCQGCKLIKGEEVFRQIKPYLKNTLTIAVDGPLSFGPGKGKMRLYEKFLSTKIFRKAHVNPLPPILIKKITEEGILLTENFSHFGFSKDIDVIETFPTFVLALCGGIKKLIKKVDQSVKIKIKMPHCPISHQQMAFTCSLVALLHAKNLTSFIGYRDGMLILPHFDFWEEKWQNKFKEAWKEKDYLKYRHLKTDVFS